MRSDNIKLKEEIASVKSTCNKVLSLLEEKFGLSSETDQESNRQIIPIIPHFSTLASAMNGGSFKNFVYEFLSNESEISFERLSNEEKKQYRSKFNKQKLCISTFRLFMPTINEKPLNAIDFEHWKGNLHKSVSIGISRVEAFIHKYPEFKPTKAKITITESLMSKKKNIQFIKEKLPEFCFPDIEDLDLPTAENLDSSPPIIDEHCLPSVTRRNSSKRTHDTMLEEV